VQLALAKLATFNCAGKGIWRNQLGVAAGDDGCVLYRLGELLSVARDESAPILAMGSFSQRYQPDATGGWQP